LRGVVLRTPALDERREDIPMLAAHFLARAAKKKRLKFSPEALAWLAAQQWPGNVRELKACVDCAAALAESVDATLSVADLAFARGGASSNSIVSDETLPAAIEKLERRMIDAALIATERNHSAAARRLGLSRVGLLKMMTRLGLR
jgi:DNA-binding NtrC family response regulator